MINYFTFLFALPEKRNLLYINNLKYQFVIYKIHKTQFQYFDLWNSHTQSILLVAIALKEFFFKIKIDDLSTKQVTEKGSHRYVIAENIAPGIFGGGGGWVGPTLPKAQTKFKK